MPYKYVVVWFERSKFWLSRDEKGRKMPRPIEYECKLFRSLNKAKEFRKGWIPPLNIYVLINEKKKKN